MTGQEFDALYHTHAAMVFNLALNYLQNREDAEEVTQDVFLKVYRKYESFQHQAEVKTWIYRITLNACADWVKSRTAQKRSWLRFSFSAAEPDSPEYPVDFDHPGVKLENREALREAFRQINGLPTLQKQAFLLKHLDGLPLKEIAEVMKTSPKAVESLLSRARKKIGTANEK